MRALDHYEHAAVAARYQISAHEIHASARRGADLRGGGSVGSSGAGRAMQVELRPVGDIKPTTGTRAWNDGRSRLLVTWHLQAVQEPAKISPGLCLEGGAVIHRPVVRTPPARKGTQEQQPFIVARHVDVIV